MKNVRLLSAVVAVQVSSWICFGQEVPNPITYQLPFDGAEKTYRVTIAAAPAEDPDWIVSTFVAGAARTVNAQNKGVFTESWDAQDDNYKPVPGGDYVFKGIYMPAEKWKIDGQQHSIVPQFISSPGDSWTPTREQDRRFPVVHGHVFEPIYNIATAEGGKAVFLAGYVENWFNPFIVDLNKDVGMEQVLTKFNSSGRAGGHLVAYDGRNVWMVRHREIFCPTNGKFGATRNRQDRGITLLAGKGRLTDLTVVNAAGKPVLYICDPGQTKLRVVDGVSGTTLAPMTNASFSATCPDRATKERRLYGLQQVEGRWQVSALALKNGLPDGTWSKLFELPESIKSAGDLEMDTKGNFYVIAGRQVHKISPDGKFLFTIGKNQPQNGRYDPMILCGARKLAVWTDTEGKERLLVTEAAGAQRIGEWSCVDGQLIRSWFLCQNGAAGSCLDPEAPDCILTTSLIGGDLLRFRVDLDTGGWQVDAIWEGLCRVPYGRMFPECYVVKGHKYICFGGGSFRAGGQWFIYRWDNTQNRWLMSSGCIANRWWHDANGNGLVEEHEYIGDNKGPSGSYWGEKILPDLSLMNITKHSNRIWRNAPKGFDAHGNPMYDASGWKVVVTDPFVGRLDRTRMPPLRGGNEIGTKFWDWSDVTGSAENGFYVAGVYKPDGRPGFKYDEAGNVCSQWKLTFWERQGDAYKMKWRVGRKAFGVAAPGQVYATMHISQPVYGILGMMDGNGIYHLFTTDGLYVDTLMYDRFRFGRLEPGGMYSHSGGAYFGKHFLNEKNGKVYVLMGRAQHNLYEIPHWREGFIQALPIQTRSLRVAARSATP